MMERVMMTVEGLLRKVMKQARGKMMIRRRHVDKILGSNSQSLVIGKPRADIVWG